MPEKTIAQGFAEGVERAQTEKTRGQLKGFLEDFGLFRAVEYMTAGAPPPWPEALSMLCPTCLDQPATTWKRTAHGPGAGGVGHQLSFQCAHCSKESVTYWVMTRRKHEGPLSGAGEEVPHVRSVRKIGQWPPWSISPPKEVRKALPEPELDLYRKALANLSQGYGLGALAYLRRLVESQADSLLDMIEEAATLEGNAEALEGIKNARLQREAEERLRLAATVLPDSLKPAGQNPLDALFSLFSAGLHGTLSEDECLEIAANLRDALDYVFTRLRRNIEEAGQYRAGIERARELAARARKKKEGK